jgi:predicted chitinase
MTNETIISSGLFKSVSIVQAASINAIVNECDRQGVMDKRQIAYILATAYHESFNPRHPETRLTPLPEWGGEMYLKTKKYYPYYGRGFSQLTWLENYEKESKRLSIDLVNNPDLILTDIDTAANSHVHCMVNGVYTGKKLSDYINAKKCDYINARRIINGTDQAELIASYAEKFCKIL